MTDVDQAALAKAQTQFVNDGAPGSIAKPEAEEKPPFDPAVPISKLKLRLLKASNALIELATL
jgi:hypothetical protein